MASGDIIALRGGTRFLELRGSNFGQKFCSGVQWQSPQKLKKRFKLYTRWKSILCVTRGVKTTRRLHYLRCFIRGGEGSLKFTPRICINLTGAVTAAGGGSGPLAPWPAPCLRAERHRVRHRIVRQKPRHAVADRLPDDVLWSRLVLLVVDTHDEHGCVWRRRWDDDLLGTALQVQTGLVNTREAARRLDDILRTVRSPRDLLRLTAVP